MNHDGKLYNVATWPMGILKGPGVGGTALQ